MAVSLANTLTSRLWKGEPKVVIRGKFSLGLVTSSNGAASGLYFLAPFLYFGATTRGLADAAAGKTFTVQVTGRQSDYASDQDGQISGGITWFSEWSTTVQAPAYEAVDPYYAAFSSARVAQVPYVDEAVHVVAMGANSHSGATFGAVSDAEESYRGYLKTVVASDVRIALRGPISSLDLTSIKAAGFFYRELTNAPRTQIATTPATTITLDGVSQSTGWHPLDVHVYDNPGLRGHVTAGNVPVFWG